jgi:hypothetical protein
VRGKVDLYRAELRKLGNWDAYLEANSGLPGPRANLELLAVAGDEASAEQLWKWSTSAGEFLSACGAAGLGRFALTNRRVLPHLERLAADPRWRTREGVAMALQRLGRQDMGTLIGEMQSWAGKRPYVQRAAAAGLCEPALLTDAKDAVEVLEVLDRITSSLAAATDRRSGEIRVLRQGLGYCWSVAAAAAPVPARPLIERWLRSPDPDVLWIMKTNLTKARMSALGEEWLAARRKRFGL